MKKPDLKYILALSWPFIGLIFFLILGWIYVRPMLPEDFAGLDGIKKLFQKKEIQIHPDEKYNFCESQNNLKPKSLEKLEKNVFSSVILSDSEESRGLESTIKVSTSAELVNVFKNIQNKDIIEISSGEYEINLEINKNITLSGQGTSTILTAKDNEKALIKIDNKQVKINNLKIKDSPIGIEIYQGKLEIENVEFENSSKTACYTKDAELIFKNNYIHDSNSAIKAINSSGEIQNSIIKNNNKSGIDLRASKFSIKNNIITKNKSYGVFADIDSELQVNGNFIDNNKGFNVRIEKEGDIYR